MGLLFPQKYFSPNQQRSFGRTGYICRLRCVPLRTYLLKSESSSLHRETRPPAINPTIERKSWHILWQAIMDKSAREFSSSRDFFFRVEIFFFESRFFFFESRKFFSQVENFFRSQNFFYRVENYFFDSNSDN